MTRRASFRSARPWFVEVVFVLFLFIFFVPVLDSLMYGTALLERVPFARNEEMPPFLFTLEGTGTRSFFQGKEAEFVRRLHGPFIFLLLRGESPRR